jgi:hypothetical protein
VAAAVVVDMAETGEATGTVVAVEALAAAVVAAVLCGVVVVAGVEVAAAAAVVVIGIGPTKNCLKQFFMT